MNIQTGYSLINNTGERKYLNRRERMAFYSQAQKLPLERKMFCLLLYFTGARISEIYELTPQQIDLNDKSIIIRTLKRRKLTYRQNSLPDNIIREISTLWDLHRLNHENQDTPTTLWCFTLRTAARIVKRVMNTVGIFGKRACARGLRHGFAVHAVNKMSLVQLQKWLGHAHLSTTAIYLDVIGDEARKIAERLWDEEE